MSDDIVPFPHLEIGNIGSAQDGDLNVLDEEKREPSTHPHYQEKAIKGRLAQLRTEQDDGTGSPMGTSRDSPADTDISHGSQQHSPGSPSDEATDVSVSSPGSPNVDHEITEEEMVLHEAANNIQRVLRGHQARRIAMYTPVWIKYPEPSGADGWMYPKSATHGKSVREYQSDPEYFDKLDILQVVLEQGINALPSTVKATGDRPYALPRSRATVIEEIILFCSNISVAYLREGLADHAAFMLSAVEAICAMCMRSNICQNCVGLHLWALDELAKLRYMSQDIRDCLLLLDKAVEIHETTKGCAGRLPYVLLQSHRACALSGTLQVHVCVCLCVCVGIILAQTR
jgi:hypothetical protein